MHAIYVIPSQHAEDPTKHPHLRGSNLTLVVALRRPAFELRRPAFELHRPAFAPISLSLSDYGLRSI